MLSNSFIRIDSYCWLQVKNAENCPFSVNIEYPRYAYTRIIYCPNNNSYPHKESIQKSWRVGIRLHST